MPTFILLIKQQALAGASIQDGLLSTLFTSGISLINYFGHSSASILDYNLSNPADYSNYKKYPVFLVNGCDAGDIFSFDTARFTSFNSLSETWVLTPNRGSIAYLASTHYGIANYLDVYINAFYNSFVRTRYDAPISYNLKDAVTSLVGDWYGFYSRFSC